MNPAIAAADTARRVTMIRELQRFRHEYRRAYERWPTHGHLETVTFSYGTFQMRR